MISSSLTNGEANIERQQGTCLSDVEKSHLGRYMWACNHIKTDDKVMDLCCGTGYGSYLMSILTKASSIVAIDKIDEFPFRHLADASVVTMLSINLESYYDIKDYITPKDVVTAFECIEHIDKPNMILDVAAMALKPGGRLLLSTPNQDVIPFTRERFPYHVQHFTMPQMATMLIKHGFVINKVYSQSKGSMQVYEHTFGRYLLFDVIKLEAAK